MSLVVYNDVTLPMSQLTHFEQKVMYDESNTDWYCTRFDIAVQCVITPSWLQYMAPFLHRIEGVTSSPKGATEIMTAVRKKLLTPRKRLSITMNGVELIPKQQQGLTGIMDAQNGPRPMSCTLLQLSNDTYIVSFHIVAHYWENLNNSINDDGSLKTINKQAAVVLYNRWSEEIEIDETDHTRRIREGKFVIRSDNADGIMIDQLRSSMAVVGCPNGFNREYSRFKVDPSGLAMEYTVIDREVDVHPPSPAFKAIGTYTETSTVQGATRFGQVRVELHGNANVSRSFLLETAAKVAASKIRIGLPIVGDRGFGLLPNEGFVGLQSAAFSMDMYRNIASCTMLVRLVARKERKHKVAGFKGTIFEQIARTPGSTATGRPSYHDRGTTTYLIEAAKYYVPDFKNVELTKTANTEATTFVSKDDKNLSRGLQVGRGGVQLEP
jgi:hypothetical protein